MNRNAAPWERDRIRGRIFIITSFVHAGINAATLFAIVLMTRGNGEVKPASAAIDAVAAIWQVLAMPLAWTVQILIDPSWGDSIPFAVAIGLRIINSLMIGLAVAYLWPQIRQRSAP